MSDQGSPPPPPPPGGGFPPPPPPPPPPPSGFGGPPPAGYTPYQPGGVQPTVGGERAGFWIRFAAAFVDGIIIAIPVGILIGILGIDSQGVGTLIRLLVAAPYFVLQESSSGQTLGKKLCSIKVVDQHSGAIIDQGRALTRYLISIVSGFACGLGYFWMLWDSDKQTWHDKGSQTYVVKV